MVLAEELSAASAVDSRVVPSQRHLSADGPSAHRVGTHVAVAWPLPVCSCDFLLGVSADWRWFVRRSGGRRMGKRGRCGGVVGFEDVEALELLVQDCEGLELLCLFHLLLEPVLDLILLLLDEVLVVIVEMSGDGQNGTTLQNDRTSTG
jgi:hypothetical protein